MTARCGAECPHEQADNGQKCDSTGSAVSEFYERGLCRIMLNYGAVAERPVVSAASAGAGGAYCGAPNDDCDVVGENTPGETVKSPGTYIGASRY